MEHDFFDGSGDLGIDGRLFMYLIIYLFNDAFSLTQTIIAA
jgi:hypothetical protein